MKIIFWVIMFGGIVLISWAVVYTLILLRKISKIKHLPFQVSVPQGTKAIVSENNQAWLGAFRFEKPYSRWFNV